MANGNDSKDTRFILSEKEKFDDLVKIGRHLAHELNNLLTTILANTQLVSLMVEDEELKSYLSAVEDAAGDAGTIVREFQESVRTFTELSS